MAPTNSKPIEVKDFSIDYNAFDEDECKKIFTEYGICVVRNAFTDDFVDAKVDQLVSIFESFGSGVTRTDPSTLSGFSVPIETKPGMFHGLVGNLPPLWEIRKSPVIKKVFSAIYGHKEDFIVSSDGLTLTPNQAYPQPADWPHVDQTVLGMLKCIQGQVVLANTTACFICSPKSHHIHKDALTMYDAVNRHGNFLRLDDDMEKLAEVKRRVGEVGGTWQIPIQVPKGSFILWASSLIHSARPTVVKEDSVATDPWKGWRCVFYICLRPAQDLSEEEIRLRAASLMKNRQTNHWCSVVFPKRPGDRSTNKHAVMESLIDHPAHVYKFVPLPDVSDPVIREFSGIDRATKNNAEIANLLKLYQRSDIGKDELANQLDSFVVSGLDDNTYNIRDAIAGY